MLKNFFNFVCCICVSKKNIWRKQNEKAKRTPTTVFFPGPVAPDSGACKNIKIKRKSGATHPGFLFLFYFWEIRLKIVLLLWSRNIYIFLAFFLSQVILSIICTVYSFDHNFNELYTGFVLFFVKFENCFFWFAWDSLLAQFCLTLGARIFCFWVHYH